MCVGRYPRAILLDTQYSREVEQRVVVLLLPKLLLNRLDTEVEDSLIKCLFIGVFFFFFLFFFFFSLSSISFSAALRDLLLPLPLLLVGNSIKSLDDVRQRIPLLFRKSDTVLCLGPIAPKRLDPDAVAQVPLPARTVPVHRI
ncbi:unnamed protein product [Fusarium graminearum]|nr:unnamed protein product [Fusarium graminearum]